MTKSSLTLANAQQSLRDHAQLKGAEIHQKYGPLGWHQLLALLQDRACVRYPCEISFDPGPLREGELAHAQPKGERPEDGFTIHVHPFFATQLGRVAPLVLYQLVIVNYGDFAGPEDAEQFGAACLGLAQEEYYQLLCRAAEELK